MHTMKRLAAAGRGWRPVALALALAMAGSAQAADAGWVATRTQAFLPPATATPAALVKLGGTRADPALQAAGRGAVELPPGTGRHIVLALAPQAGAAQVQAVVDYLRERGFTGIQPSASHRLVEATGSAAAIKAAFNTSLKSFQYQGREVYANDAPAQVPQALGGVVTAVLGLQNVATAHPFAAPAAAPSWPRVQLAAAAPADDAPAPGLSTHELSDFVALYNASTLPAASGRTIAILAPGALTGTLADLKAYASAHNLPAVSTQVIWTDQATHPDNPTTDLLWTTAAEAVVAAAGGVKQLIFYSPSDFSDANLLLALDKIATNSTNASLAAQVVLLPFGMWEDDAVASGLMNSIDGTIGYDPQGVMPLFVAPAGDNGPYAQQQGVLEDAQRHWLFDFSQYTVNYPASSPWVDSVGGTSLYTDASGAYAYETVWNAGLSQASATGNYQLSAGGGGVSRFEFARNGLSPVAGQPNRVVPDLAMDADPNSGALIYRQGGAAPTAVGGTVLAAALYAGLALRIGSSGALGRPDYTPYLDLGSVVDGLTDIVTYTQHHLLNITRDQVVHPINSGSNGYGIYGYKAGQGYDAASGWGSLNALGAYQFLTNPQGGTKNN